MKIDPVESTPEYLAIEAELKEKIIKEIGEGGYMGYCYKYWYTKQKILLNDYGIEWKSPAQLNPHILFD